MRNPRNEASPARRILDRLQRNPRLFFWFRTGSNVDRRMAEALIEEGTTHVLKNGYSVRWDKGRQPGQQDHLHVRRNGRDVAIINKDGSGSHGYDPARLRRDVPGSVRKRIDALKHLDIELGGLEESAGPEWKVTPRDMMLVENLASL